VRNFDVTEAKMLDHMPEILLYVLEAPDKVNELFPIWGVSIVVLE